ncbi:hypothetical protein A3K34_00355 [candidate division WWE3 bacterium RIFOXYC1_FULL_40_10]|uniref:Uncharacterized protein n=1 Tax=candidate division WWE3 bacterium RIFOXYA2_FULL_46_9 TaxID=1802636 RepID=A0A1F4W1H7_UNCKA|nr:MAG: hypothetical protein A3K58_00355 [candidate division WWE3 bacterium RIFOXYB1_FULL_40_22]OGC61341.1 MAG: hypothetical protein A3K37_00355 [candidate division WWE3 bacterium RIFOXYA1_FULL_40_11]OGC63251.1 MAG: hypothetical protein A2264_01015 [candidate division WWE3 bacterium RIFOXYA2_FULL_46_9]OGC65331.1 MAG: hypothetical protein A2326_04640 [candidate division WWE3 bacterium RIFOXYB2_FULL_41_6]OGC65724.1 MAG: hypothetical protein A3K34_00355 [candidate division WWE3 bacterium RIFOXYC1_
MSIIETDISETTSPGRLPNKVEIPNPFTITNELFKKEITKISRGLLDEIGKNMAEKNKTLLENISEHTCIAPREIVRKIRQEGSETPLSEHAEVMGVCTVKDGIPKIVLQDPIEYWNNLPQYARDTMISRYSNLFVEQDKIPQAVRNLVVSQIQLETFRHEVVHVVQNRDNPDIFTKPLDECCARYYEDLLVKKFGSRIGQLEEIDRKRIAFFESLIYVFGKEFVEKACFGDSTDRLRVKEVMARFTPEIIEELFPGGTGIESKRSPF